MVPAQEPHQESMAKEYEDHILGLTNLINEAEKEALLEQTDRQYGMEAHPRTRTRTRARSRSRSPNKLGWRLRSVSRERRNRQQPTTATTMNNYRQGSLFAKLFSCGVPQPGIPDMGMTMHSAIVAPSDGTADLAPGIDCRDPFNKPFVNSRTWARNEERRAQLQQQQGSRFNCGTTKDVLRDENYRAGHGNALHPHNSTGYFKKHEVKPQRPSKLSQRQLQKKQQEDELIDKEIASLHIEDITHHHHKTVQIQETAGQMYMLGLEPPSSSRDHTRTDQDETNQSSTSQLDPVLASVEAVPVARRRNRSRSRSRSKSRQRAHSKSRRENREASLKGAKNDAAKQGRTRTSTSRLRNAGAIRVVANNNNNRNKSTRRAASEPQAGSNNNGKARRGFFSRLMRRDGQNENVDTSNTLSGSKNSKSQSQDGESTDKNKESKGDKSAMQHHQKQQQQQQQQRQETDSGTATSDDGAAPANDTSTGNVNVDVDVDGNIDGDNDATNGGVSNNNGMNFSALPLQYRNLLSRLQKDVAQLQYKAKADLLEAKEKKLRKKSESYKATARELLDEARNVILDDPVEGESLAQKAHSYAKEARTMLDQATKTMEERGRLVQMHGDDTSSGLGDDADGNENENGIGGGDTVPVPVEGDGGATADVPILKQTVTAATDSSSDGPNSMVDNTEFERQVLREDFQRRLNNVSLFTPKDLRGTLLCGNPARDVLDVAADTETILKSVNKRKAKQKMGINNASVGIGNDGISNMDGMQQQQQQPDARRPTTTTNNNNNNNNSNVGRQGMQQHTTPPPPPPLTRTTAAVTTHDTSFPHNTPTAQSSNMHRLVPQENKQRHDRSQQRQDRSLARNNRSRSRSRSRARDQGTATESRASSKHTTNAVVAGPPSPRKQRSMWFGGGVTTTRNGNSNSNNHAATMTAAQRRRVRISETKLAKNNATAAAKSKATPEVSTVNVERHAYYKGMVGV